MATIDISLLQESAIRYQKDLKFLPYAVMMAVLGEHGMNLLPGVQNKDVVTNFLRKRGIALPYAVGLTVDDQDIGKAEERVLTVEKAYASVKDNINNYKKTVVGPDVLLGKNQSKEHPWQLIMLQSIVRTFGEDLLDALFPGQRDLDDQSPLGCFDGFDTIIDDDISSGNIRVSKGNYVSTGTISLPSDEDDVDAFNTLLAFWRAAHPQLRQAPSMLLLPFGIADAYDSAFFNKFKYKPTMDDYGRSLLEGSGGKCTIVRSSIMGTGQRVTLTVPGNMDFGMNTMGDEDFVQVRTPYTDPNEIQFWIQGDYGCRIRSVHEKVFQVNDGTPVANALSGDYTS
jgi:hypothetical protein